MRTSSALDNHSIGLDAPLEPLLVRAPLRALIIGDDGPSSSSGS